MFSPQHTATGIKVIFCAHCKNRPMIIKKVKPRLLRRGTKVVLQCQKCGFEAIEEITTDNPPASTLSTRRTLGFR